jgi:hypothetical protein
MAMSKEKFNVECPRCLGSGKFDRGVCFECKGKRYVLRSRPGKAECRNLVITFDTGKQNFVKMYFFTLEYAVKAVEQQMLARGWHGTIAITEWGMRGTREIYASLWLFRERRR